MNTKIKHEVANGDEYEITLDDTSVVMYLETAGYRIEINHYEGEDKPTVLVYRDTQEIDRLVWELHP